MCCRDQLNPPREAVIRPDDEVRKRQSRRSLPIYPDERTSTERTSMSQKCQKPLAGAANRADLKSVTASGLSSSAERVVKNDDALCTIHFRAW
jgi:hypothetical protein